jgi:hypothetical protein
MLAYRRSAYDALRKTFQAALGRRDVRSECMTPAERLKICQRSWDRGEWVAIEPRFLW